MRKLLLILLILIGCGNRLDYEDVWIHEEVVRGGQREIDQGHVVDVDGLPGIWLAGHRTTHGAVFNNLVDAEVGDIVCVYGNCYHVTRIIHWPDRSNPGYLGTLVLQTSLPDGNLLVVAEP